MTTCVTDCSSQLLLATTWYFFFPNKLAKFPLNNISEEFLLPVIPFERLLQSHTKLNEITDLQGFFFFPLLTRKIDVTYLL